MAVWRKMGSVERAEKGVIISEDTGENEETKNKRVS